MDYIEFTVNGIADPEREIVIALMAELGFESFTETTDGFQAYITDKEYDADTILAELNHLKEVYGISFESQKIAQRNWNAEWERDYEPVIIAGKCIVRAPFHLPVPDMVYDIVIEPKMSFGTAHHATTSLMIEMLMLEALMGKKMLDMGCGTGVLAILACKMGAAPVVAVDNDEWAYRNTLENIGKNNAGSIRVFYGGSEVVADTGFDVIAANINRNILLEQIPFYANLISTGGTLLMSGFYESDADDIRRAAELNGFRYHSQRSAEQWAVVKFKR